MHYRRFLRIVCATEAPVKTADLRPISALLSRKNRAHRCTNPRSGASMRGRASPATRGIPRAPSRSRPRFRRRRRGTPERVSATPSRSRSVRHQVPRVQQLVHGDFENARDLAVGRRRAAAARRSPPTIGCSRKPLTGMSSGVSAPSTRTLVERQRHFLVRLAQAPPARTFRPVRRRRPAATPGRRAARAYRRARSARCARCPHGETAAAGRPRGGPAAPAGQARRGHRRHERVRGRAGRGLASADGEVGDQGGKGTRQLETLNGNRKR